MDHPPVPEESAKKRRRWPWIVLGVVVLLVAVVAIALPLLLDVERHRGRIETALRNATGWEPQLGAMSFSVLRGLVLTVSPASLAAPEGGSKFELGSLQVKAELLPLLSGELRVRSIELVRPSIELVRPSEARGWIVPIPPAREAPAPKSEGEGGFSVSIGVIDVTDGTLRVEDRASQPPLAFGLDDLDARIYPDRAELRADARLPYSGGSIGASGNWNEGLRIELDDITAAALSAFLGEGLLLPATVLDGTIDLKLPGAIDGSLTASPFGLASSERPLDRADVDFQLRAQGEAWEVPSLTLRSGGVSVQGSGRLLPDLKLNLEIPPAPIEAALGAARAVFPLPLDLESPGTASAIIDVAMPAGGELSYAARGSISSAGFRAAEFLPRAENLQTQFWLTPQGELTIDVNEGQVAGGPLNGRVVVDSISPLGTLSLDGNLTDAVLGGLLAGFIGPSAEKITGPAGLQTALALDLGAETIGVQSLSGTLGLGARQVTMPGWDLERAILEKVGVELAQIQALNALLGSEELAGLQRKLESGSGTVNEVLQSLEANVDFNTLPWNLTRFGVAASGLDARGRGTFDPVGGNVDLALTARFDREKTAELVQRVGELQYLVGSDGQITLPMTLRGSLLRPSVGVDVEQIVTSRLREEPQRRLEQEAGKLLKGLLDRD